MQRHLIVAFALIAASLCPSIAAAAGPCSIVSSADASKAIGAPVTSAVPSSLPDGATCSYRAGFKSFVVTTIPLSSASSAKDYYHQMTTSSLTAMAPSVDLPGIGDAAHRVGPMIYVRKAATIYAFSLVSTDSNTTGAMRVISVARSAIGHLH